MGILSIFLESAEMAEMLAELEQMSAMTSLLSDLISLAISIFMCVVMWKINVKAGEPGWACLIPFYSGWVDCKVAKKKWLFIPQLINAIIMVISMFALIIGIVIELASSLDSSIGIGSGFLIGSLVVFAITAIIALVLNIIYSHGLATAFGQGIGYTLGLIFLPNIFKAIIAFSNNIQYNFDDDYNLNSGYTPVHNTQPTDVESRLNQPADWNQSNFN